MLLSHEEDPSPPTNLQKVEYDAVIRAPSDAATTVMLIAMLETENKNDSLFDTKVFEK